MQMRTKTADTGLWGTFDTVRKHLEQQYETPDYNPDTGLPPEELVDRTEKYLATHTAQSRVLQKANLFRMILENGRIQVDPLDFFADRLQHENLLHDLQFRWQAEVERGPLSKEAAWMLDAIQSGYVDGVLDLGHTSPGWTVMLQLGLNGLLEKAHAARAALGDAITQEQCDFYDAVDMVYAAIIGLAGRLAALAREMADTHPENATRLLMVAEALEHVPANPPRTFHETMQFTYLMHQMFEMEGQKARSMGGFDNLYLSAFRADLDAGRLTRDQAKELIKFFWIKFFAFTQGVANGKNFYFGGCDKDGVDAVNELSTLAMEVYDELDTTDPKLSVRISKQTPDAFLRQVAGIIRQGKSSFVLVNDDVAIPALVKYGKELEEARNYLLIGCYEPAIEGREIACNMSLRINLAKTIELVLHNGIDPVTGMRMGPETGDPRKMETFDAFQNAVFHQIDAQADKSMAYVCKFETYWPEINPSPVLAGTFVDCLEKGKDIGQSGPKYNNTGSMGAGLANIADSLVAVKRLVFEDKRCTMSELIDALEKDFVGHEDLHRHIVYRLPHWGTDDDEVDAIAKKVTERYTEHINRTPNNRGGWFRASMFTLDYRYKFGKCMGATPDGRSAGAYLAGGVGAMTAMDVKGNTAQINSVTKLDFTDIPNGSVIDIYLHPSAVQGEDGLNAFVALIRTYFAKGGFGVQFNIFDSQTLRDAVVHPEKYTTLQVRVCGWNVYFTSMSLYEQEQYIEANKHLF